MLGQGRTWRIALLGRAKRRTKKNTSGIKILEQESMTVQLMSAVLSGEAQKYTRVGAREFVPFEYKEVTWKTSNWRA